MINVVLVFGGNGDIGSEICEVFAKSDYKVFASYHNRKPKVRAHNITYFYFDALSGNNLPKMLFSSLYKVIGIFFCIGIASKKKSIIHTSIDEFLLLNEVNAISFIKIIQGLYPIIKKGSLNIIVLNSTAIIRNGKNSGPYTASKNYLHSIVMSLNAELGNNGVKIKEIFLPPVKGRMMEEIALMKGYDNLEIYIEQKLHGKILMPVEIASACKKFLEGENTAIDELLKGYL